LEWTLTLFFLINWLIVGIDFAKSHRASQFSAMQYKIAQQDYRKQCTIKNIKLQDPLEGEKEKPRLDISNRKRKQ
jgi:hypothetical protein